MPRRALLACAGVVALLMSGTVIPKSLKAQVVQTAGGVTVSVDIRCLADNGVSFTLIPWRAELAQGDTIGWKLDRNSGVTEITIASKQTGWPFNDNQYKGNAAIGPKAKSMKPNQLNKKYAYSITAACLRADGTTSSIIIDPDLIIVH